MNKPLKLSPHWRFRNVSAIAVSRPAMTLRATTMMMEVSVNCYCLACAVACLTSPTCRENRRLVTAENK